jgi:hypothetical protein
MHRQQHITIALCNAVMVLQRCKCLVLYGRFFFSPLIHSDAVGWQEHASLFLSGFRFLNRRAKNTTVVPFECQFETLCYHSALTILNFVVYISSPMAPVETLVQLGFLEKRKK